MLHTQPLEVPLAKGVKGAKVVKVERAARVGPVGPTNIIHITVHKHREDSHLEAKPLHWLTTGQPTKHRKSWQRCASWPFCVNCLSRLLVMLLVRLLVLLLVTKLEKWRCVCQSMRDRPICMLTNEARTL